MDTRTASAGPDEARYRALFEAIDDGFCIIEFFDGPHGPLSDYVHIEANAGYERQTGISGIVGRTLRDLAPAQADEWAALYGAVLRTGQPLRFERYFQQAGRHIEVSASRVEPESLRQVAVLFRDVEARVRAEAALRASEAVARENVQRVNLALAAGAIIGTWNWDVPTDRFAVDEAFARSFGLDPKLGRDGLSLAQLAETVHPDDRPGVAVAINEAIKRGGPYAHEYSPPASSSARLSRLVSSLARHLRQASERSPQHPELDTLLHMHHVQFMPKTTSADRANESLQVMAETCVMMRTRLVARAITAIYDDRLRPFGLNASQCSLLVVIFGLGTPRRVEIGRFNQLDRSTLSRNLQIMLANGWIEEIETAKPDGRGKPIALSKAGKDLLREAFPAWREAQGKAKEVLGQEGVSILSGIGNGLMGSGSQPR